MVLDRIHYSQALSYLDNTVTHSKRFGRTF
jgi:hypothetical protein